MVTSSRPISLTPLVLRERPEVEIRDRGPRAGPLRPNKFIKSRRARQTQSAERKNEEKPPLGGRRRGRRT